MSDEVVILPRSAIVKVSFDVSLPCDATKEEILEWISHNLNEGGIDMDNPLLQYGMEAITEPTLSETNLYLHEEAKKTETGWTIRKWKSPSPYNGPDQMEVAINDIRRHDDD